jgi:hypothetical protein
MRALLSLRHLYPSVQEHRQVEVEVLRRLRETLPLTHLTPPPKPPRLLRYAEKNAFSILFLAIYRALGIGAERRNFYGVVNHALRGIVTATDNLLDDEYKEMLPFDFPESATRFKSVMHILVFDRILASALGDAVTAGVLAPEARAGLGAQLFHALVAIGTEEASEEGGVEAILPPEEILESVHSRKGCDLLRLAFVAPRHVEKERTRELELSDQGVCRIGLALQMVDDLVDVAEDLRGRRHNYLVSSVWHEGPPAEKERLRSCLEERESCELRAEELEGASRRVMERAMVEALGGFDALEQAGFWIGAEEARPLLRRLFYLRGAGPLWELLRHTSAGGSG